MREHVRWLTAIRTWQKQHDPAICDLCRRDQLAVSCSSCAHTAPQLSVHMPWWWQIFYEFYLCLGPGFFNGYGGLNYSAIEQAFSIAGSSEISPEWRMFLSRKAVEYAMLTLKETSGDEEEKN